MPIADTFPTGLRPKQVTGALQIKMKRRVLLADQPGAGKTAQALVAAELDGIWTRPSVTLIATTLTACQLTWADELNNRLASQYDVVIADLTAPDLHYRTGLPKKQIPTVAERDARLATAVMEAAAMELPLVILANFDLLRWKYGEDAPKLPTLWDLELDMVVLDESHLVLPTMEDHFHKLSQFWNGLRQLDIKADAIRLPMSGTPDRGKLHNRYGTWKFLYTSGYQNFWGWARDMFVVSDNEDRPGVSIGKLRNPEQWAAYDAKHMIRRTKAEMLEGLPEKQWAGDGGIDLAMTREQAEAYENYLDEMAAEREELLASDDVADNRRGEAMKMQVFLRSRQMATCTWNFHVSYDAQGNKHVTGKPIVAGPGSSNKLAWMLGWLESRGHSASNWDASLGKVVIVSYFTEVLHWLKAELLTAGVPAIVMDGSTPVDEKLAIEAQFQRGALRVVLLSGYLGVSINLDAADDMIFVDSVHDPDKMEQAEDRIHRASRNHQVTYWRLASKGTADIAVLQTVDTRYRETRKTYDGDRGVEFARMMMPHLAEREMV